MFSEVIYKITMTSPSRRLFESQAKTWEPSGRHFESRTLEGHAHLLLQGLLSARTCGETLSLPSIFTVGGLASLEGVPQGTLSHTHLGSDTVALNERIIVKVEH